LAADHKTAAPFPRTTLPYAATQNGAHIIMPLQSIRIRTGATVALDDYRGRSAAVSRSSVSHMPSLWLTTEQRLIRAYLALHLVARDEDGIRAARLAGFGTYEVRLCEPPDVVALDTFPVWIELYCHARGVTLDSCGRDNLDDAVDTADEFIERAKMLHLEGGDGISPPRKLADGIVRALREAGLECRLAV
jgi:hypothetical protein